MSVGVIVGRFQIDQPHPGHIDLIEKVTSRHGKVLVLLGCAPNRLGRKNALDYEIRAKMMNTYFPRVLTAPIYDMPDDKAWSSQLDSIVRDIFPTDFDITLYGGRQAFFPHYHGSYKVVEIETVKVPSATEVRDHLGQVVDNNPSFRHGVIWACYNRFPISYQVVDVAIVQKEGSVLLCRKLHDKRESGGFIGGFVDVRDLTLEHAAKREVLEETGLEVGNLRYVGSFRIPDWRYRDDTDKMMSAFFVADYVYGHPKAADDIVACEWVGMEYLPQRIVPHHLPLALALISHLSK
jgi:bifunctional NMN adenylyltransferase/nudix hydrolase